jgi:hypothetical protein
VQCGVSNSFNSSYSLSSVAEVVGFTPPTDSYATNLLAQGPIAYWRLNEPAGSTVAYDYINGYDGAYGADTTNGIAGIPNPPFYGVPTNDLGVWMDHSVGTTAGFVTTPALNIVVTNCTLTCWVYPNGTQANSEGVVFSRGTLAAGINFGASEYMAYTWGTNTATYSWTSGLSIPTNQWSFLALVITPSNATAYVFNTNGSFVNTNNVANPPQLINAGFDIGADTTSLPARIFNGEMDEVAVFDYALQSSQLTQMYGSASLSTAPPTAPSITVQRAGNSAVITWSAGANLFSAPSVKGPWTMVTNAVSPYTNTPSSGPEFYKAGTPYTP